MLPASDAISTLLIRFQHEDDLIGEKPEPSTSRKEPGLRIILAAPARQNKAAMDDLSTANRSIVMRHINAKTPLRAHWRLNLNSRGYPDLLSQM
ncbi:hypothetical protein MPC4_410007 [Methylocella tundrae]|uniref:Uncharacterized protein n=1 Tax=Methylocella tundrae TaxID=227605 RepID=A0A8B6M9N0_METTU|nr:hypothetical protein MPC4_410007 [Methylocella tundrae]